MKKALIFIALFSVLKANEYKEIAEESALKVNEKCKTEIKELITIPSNIYTKQIETKNETKGNFSVSYGLSTNHIKYGVFKDEYKFNEDNNLIILEYRLKNDSLGVATFKNSFYNQSYAAYYGHYSKLTKKLELNYKLGIIKGYNAEDSLLSEDGKTRIYFPNQTVFYKDYSLMATVGLQYNFNEHFGLSVDLLSNAIESSVKYTF